MGGRFPVVVVDVFPYSVAWRTAPTSPRMSLPFHSEGLLQNRPFRLWEPSQSSVKWVPIFSSGWSGRDVVFSWRIQAQFHLLHLWYKVGCNGTVSVRLSFYFIIIIIIIIIKIINVTANGLLPGGINMNKGSKKFKSGGLHEKHAVATWSLGNHLSIRL